MELNTLADFTCTDGPGDPIAHGLLRGGPVALFAADASGDEPALDCKGLMLSLLGTASLEVMRGWFAALAEDGRVVEDLQRRPWARTTGEWSTGTCCFG